MNKNKALNYTYEIENLINKLREIGFTKREKGFRNSERFVLFLIDQIGEGAPVTPSEIAKKLGVTLSAISHHINSLEKQGFVQRSFSTENKRITNLLLTDKGHIAIEEFKIRRSEKIAEMIEYLGEADTKKLLEILSKVYKYLNKNTDEEVI